MQAPDAAIRELEERLGRYPPERYPVQHATARFHLGVALATAGRPEEAAEELAAAAGLFGGGLGLERAKALNARGAALRLAGRLGEAAGAFEEAAAGFERAGAPLERGAALFNLGLVRRDDGDPGAAVRPLETARALLDPGRVPAQAAAAARELGAALLAAGEPGRAAALLAEAVAEAEEAGDTAGRGAAANALGLARLAEGETAEAIEAFRAAAGAHPRSVRPHDFAMTKANLALAYEQAGDARRARLAARQALGVSGVPAPVAAQARAALTRLGADARDLVAVLDDEPPERIRVLVREEVVRWADAPESERRADVAAWIEGQLAQRESAVELAEAWVAALLELPPAAMEAVVRSALAALAGRPAADVERFGTDVAAAALRFHPPQTLRLEAAFRRIATDVGLEDGWG